jgi:hypothetical protein
MTSNSTSNKRISDNLSENWSHISASLLNTWINESSSVEKVSILVKWYNIIKFLSKC